MSSSKRFIITFCIVGLLLGIIFSVQLYAGSLDNSPLSYLIYIDPIASIICRGTCSDFMGLWYGITVPISLLVYALVIGWALYKYLPAVSQWAEGSYLKTLLRVLLWVLPSSLAAFLVYSLLLEVWFARLYRIHFIGDLLEYISYLHAWYIILFGAIAGFLLSWPIYFYKKIFAVVAVFFSNLGFLLAIQFSHGSVLSLQPILPQPINNFFYRITDNISIAYLLLILTSILVFLLMTRWPKVLLVVTPVVVLLVVVGYFMAVDKLSDQIRIINSSINNGMILENDIVK